MTVIRAKLGDVCDFVYGSGLPERDRDGGKYPVYGSNGIVGWHSEAITKSPTIVIGRKGSIGEIHISSQPCWPIDTTYYVDNTKLPTDFRWLYYTLSVLDLAGLNRAAAVPGLNRNDAYEQDILFPPIEEQKRIAAILDKADRLRRLRRYALQLSDTFLQSVFLQMFADPVTNPMGWEEFSLSDLLSDIIDYRGKTPPKSKQGVPLISAANIKNGRVHFTPPQFISWENYRKWTTRGFTMTGDVLITTEAPVGEVAAYPKTGVYQISRRVMALRPKPEIVLSSYLLQVMLFPTWHNRLTSVTRGSTVPRVLKPDITTQSVPCPPLSLQKRFNSVVTTYEKLRAEKKEAIRQADHLFDTLLHRAFNGEI